MVGPIHVLWWIAMTAWCISLGVTPDASMWAFVFAPVISQLPDLDQEESHISNTMFFSNFWMILRDYVSWHREETHTIFWTILFWLIIFLPVIFIFNFQTWILFMLIYFSHLLMDLFNKQGLKLFYIPKLNENADRYTVWNVWKKIIYKINKSEPVVEIVEKIKFFKFSFPVWDTVTYLVFAVPSFIFSLLMILSNLWFYSSKMINEVNLLHSNIFIFLGLFSFLILSKNPLMPPEWEIIRFLKSIKENAFNYSEWDFEALHYIFVSSNFTVLMLSILFLFWILTNPQAYWDMMISTTNGFSGFLNIFKDWFSFSDFFNRILSFIWNIYEIQLKELKNIFNL